jgi:hypothetical protein
VCEVGVGLDGFGFVVVGLGGVGGHGASYLSIELSGDWDLRVL